MLSLKTQEASSTIRASPCPRTHFQKITHPNLSMLCGDDGGVCCPIWAPAPAAADMFGSGDAHGYSACVCGGGCCCCCGGGGGCCCCCCCCCCCDPSSSGLTSGGVTEPAVGVFGPNIPPPSEEKVERLANEELNRHGTRARRPNCGVNANMP